MKTVTNKEMPTKHLQRRHFKILRTKLLTYWILQWTRISLDFYSKRS